MDSTYESLSEEDYSKNLSDFALKTGTKKTGGPFSESNFESLELQSATALIFSLISWSTLYFITIASLNRTPEFCTRVVTLIHGLMTTAMGSYVCKMKMEDKIEGMDCSKTSGYLNNLF